MPLIEGVINVGWVGLQVYGICGCRLAYSEVVEARSDYKKYYLCWFRNPGCDNLTGSNWIGVPPGLVREKGEEGKCDLLCVLDDWTNGVSVDIFLNYAEYGFSSMRI